MVVDTSAVLAILFAEEDRNLYINALAGNQKKFMTPVNALEADIVIQARKGDCCAYALSVYLKEPLLFKGDDFSKTDILSFL